MFHDSAYHYDPSEDKRRRKEIYAKMETKQRTILKKIDNEFYRKNYRDTLKKKLIEIIKFDLND